MKKIIYILIAFSVFGCAQSDKGEIITNDLRHLLVYENDSLVRNDDYSMETREKDSIVVYEYFNLGDSTKNMIFQFEKFLDIVHFGSMKFELVERNVFKTEIEFDRYETEPVPDGMGSLFFNKDYGILGFDNGWGAHFHYLTDKNIEQFDLPLFY